MGERSSEMKELSTEEKGCKVYKTKWAFALASEHK